MRHIRQRLFTNTADCDCQSALLQINGLPLYRCSHTFQSVSLSGSRLLERSGTVVTRKTVLNKYLDCDKKDETSFYDFICKSGKVPVLAGNSVQATYPLNEEYCRSSLILHCPNWRNITDIKAEQKSWIEQFEDFLITDRCPNFVKAQVKIAKDHALNNSNPDEEEEEESVDIHDVHNSLSGCSFCNQTFKQMIQMISHMMTEGLISIGLFLTILFLWSSQKTSLNLLQKI